MKKKWLEHNWKWAIPTIVITLFISVFFCFTEDAAFRYASAYLQPNLIEEAYKMANDNEIVIEKLGKLSPYNFLRLIEGEVAYSNNNNTIAVTINLLGSKKKGKLDILANKKGNRWSYQKINVRIKKPKKETIAILE